MYKRQVSNSFSSDVVTMQSTNQELQSLLSKLKELNNSMDTTKTVSYTQLLMLKE